MSKGQRDRIYDAEDEIVRSMGEWYAGAIGAQFHVDEFLRKKYWRQGSTCRYVTIEYPTKETGVVFISPVEWKIGYRPLSLNSINLGHELTHIYIGVTPGLSAADHNQDHSAHFAATELQIIQRLLGRETEAALRNAFSRHGVIVADVK